MVHDPAARPRAKLLPPEAVDDALCLAGWIAMRLPPMRFPSLRLQNYGAIDEVQTAYGYTTVRAMDVRPTAAEIDFADEVSQWPGFLPKEDIVKRRIVSFRMQWDDRGNRHLFPWKLVGNILRCSPVAAKAWHRAALQIIAAEVNRSPARLDTLRRLGSAMNHGGAASRTSAPGQRHGAGTI